MTKLAEIIGPFANAVGAPEKSINVLAMHLRKAGLITKGGRGTAGAEMQASDATNMLLGVMVGGDLKDAPDRVSFMRAAHVRSIQVSPNLEEKGPPIPFSINGDEGDFGRTMDALFQQLIEYSLLNVKTRLPITNYSLKITEPDFFGGTAELWIDDGTDDVTITYRRNGRAFEKVPPEKWNEIARKYRRGRRADGIKREAVANTDTLVEIARCFRGGD